MSYSGYACISDAAAVIKTAKITLMGTPRVSARR